jgi:hypothetical protein
MWWVTLIYRVLFLHSVKRSPHRQMFQQNYKFYLLWKYFVQQFCYASFRVLHAIAFILKIIFFSHVTPCTVADTYQPDSLSLFPVAPTLEHRASVKRFVSLQFLNLRQSVGLLGRGISPSQRSYLYKHRINTDKYPCLEWDSNSRSQRSSGRRRFMP